MGREIDLLMNYPKTKRDTKGRAAEKSEEVRAIARRFGKEFFDGDRCYGYGGFNYHPRFWEPVIPDLQRQYQLTGDSRVLDIGCAKGFMLYDMQRLIPGIQVKGIDTSDYAIAHAKQEVKPYIQVASAVELPFDDHSFDLVIAINTIHNLEEEDCFKALQEIERVGRGSAFVTVDAYRSEEEKERMFEWNLTARIIKSMDGWQRFFAEAGYTGDYFWFIP